MTSTPPPSLVFDLDGTLVDTAPDLIRALNFVLTEDGMPPISADIIGSLVGRGARMMIMRALEHHGLDASQGHVDRLVDSFITFYGAHIAVDSRIFPGVVETLMALKDNGWALSVCTNKKQDLALALLDALGLQSFFNAICGGDYFAVAKPDPRHLTGTILRAASNMDHALMVGDSQTDILTAKAAGIPVVGVTFGYCEQPIETYTPDFIISDFSQLLPIAAKQEPT